MGPSVRKLALSLHVVSSVGWLGAVGVFLALSVLGLVGSDGAVVRAVYLAMEPIGWSVLVPLSFVSLLTGLVQSLGTTWGLFRHYWVVFKLLINLVATAILLLYMQTLGALADLAATTTATDVGALRNPSPVLHAGVGMVLLLLAVVLSVYKPRGMTPHGQRARPARRATVSASEPSPAPDG